MIHLTEDITLNLVIINYGKEEGAKFERLFLLHIGSKRFSSGDNFLWFVMTCHHDPIINYWSGK